jgi:hypothetical protein
MRIFVGIVAGVFVGAVAGAVLSTVLVLGLRAVLAVWGVHLNVAFGIPAIAGAVGGATLGFVLGGGAAAKSLCAEDEEWRQRG